MQLIATYSTRKKILPRSCQQESRPSVSYDGESPRLRHRLQNYKQPRLQLRPIPARSLLSSLRHQIFVPSPGMDRNGPRSGDICGARNWSWSCYSDASLAADPAIIFRKSDPKLDLIRGSRVFATLVVSQTWRDFRFSGRNGGREKSRALREIEQNE